MKTAVFTLVLASTLLTSNAFALEVNGPKAEKLFDTLKLAGAQVRQFTEVAMISVADVRGTTSLSSQGVFGTVEMKDDNTGRVVRESDREDNANRKAANMLEAMVNAGVKPVIRMGGNTIDAKSINCTSGHMMARAIYQCTIK